jgi:tetratricopeptide (TPR) repeat protein
LGKYGEALEYFFKAVKIMELKLGVNHISTATTYYKIGGVYSKLGKYGEALDYYSRALKIYE